MVVKDTWWVGCCAILLAIAGCSDADKPTDDDYDGVAQALGSVTATDGGGGEVGTLVDVSVIASGTPRTGINLMASGEFSGNKLGVTYDYDVTCADSAGAKLDSCTNASDSADVNVKWSGELSTAILSGVVSRTGMIKLTKIQSGTVTVAGAGNLTIDAEFKALFRDATRSYHLAYDAKYEDVQVARAQQKVVGGSIHYALDVERHAMDAKRTSSATFEITADLVWSADGSAKLTLDGDHTYNVNTTTGAVAEVNAGTKG